MDFFVKWLGAPACAREGTRQAAGLSRIISDYRKRFSETMARPFICEKCGRGFTPGQALYYERRIERSGRGSGLSFISVCYECRLGARDEYLQRSECHECHRPIYSYDVYRAPWFCSKACRIKVQTRRQKERRHEKRRPIRCAVCDREFLPVRVDAKTCSGRCRARLSRSTRRALAASDPWEVCFEDGELGDDKAYQGESIASTTQRIDARGKEREQALVRCRALVGLGVPIPWPPGGT
jgi:hypothetical protein